LVRKQNEQKIYDALRSHSRERLRLTRKPGDFDGKKWRCRWIWVNYNDLTATSLEIMVNKGHHPKMALIQVGEIL